MTLQSLTPLGNSNDESRVVPISPGSLNVDTSGHSVKKPRVKKNHGFLWSFILIAILPTLIGGVYFGFIAADQYAVETSFIIKGNQSAPSDILGMISGFGGGSSTSNDSYAVIDYINSAPMVQKLLQNNLFIPVYASQKADWFSRLDPSVPLEEMVYYWKKRQSAYFDSVKQSVKIEVRAFQPEDAKVVAEFVKNSAENLVNQLSLQSRRDAIEWAQKEVKREEDRLKIAQKAITNFQEQQNTIDPGAVAQSILGMIMNMETERSKLAAQLESVSNQLSARAPLVVSLRAQIEALDAQIKNYRDQIANGKEMAVNKSTSTTRIVVNSPISNQLGIFQELQMEFDFSQKAYTAALASLESARSEATRRELYFQTYIEPTTPMAPIYPERVTDIFLIFISACSVWVLGSLIILGVKDHIT